MPCERSHVKVVWIPSMTQQCLKNLTDSRSEVNGYLFVCLFLLFFILCLFCVFLRLCLTLQLKLIYVAQADRELCGNPAASAS